VGYSIQSYGSNSISWWAYNLISALQDHSADYEIG